MVARRAPLLFFNPPEDVAFAQLARELAEAGATEPSDLERGLRETYPAAVVRARDLADEALEVWYVYREGHWVASS